MVAPEHSVKDTQAELVCIIPANTKVAAVAVVLQNVDNTIRAGKEETEVQDFLLLLLVLLSQEPEVVPLVEIVVELVVLAVEVMAVAMLERLIQAAEVERQMQVVVLV
jgi:hypothetical protein